MALSVTISEIRKRNGLTQDELAGKLFVTRQAVSRWENGETTPAIETLKKISELFKVDANAFFGGETPVCQSCAMPLRNLDDIGSNADGAINPDYCKYCFNGGKFIDDKTVDEMVETNLLYLSQYNAENGVEYSEEDARNILKQYLPTLKRWKKGS
jgi:transcriptional regulator with XRE-family HTH domain